MPGTAYQPNTKSPAALAVIVLLHGAALTAVALAKMDVIKIDRNPIDVFNVIQPKDPDPIPPEPQPRPTPRQETRIDTPIAIVPIDRSSVIVQPTIEQQPIFVPDPGPTIVLPSPPPPTPPAPPAKKVEPARARANLASYVSDADYPAAAIRGEEQGRTSFRLEVGADGRVTACTVTASSGSNALDSATCRLMKSRAKFAPARDSNGKAVGDTVTSSIRWVLPEA